MESVILTRTEPATQLFISVFEFHQKIPMNCASETLFSPEPLYSEPLYLFSSSPSSPRLFRDYFSRDVLKLCVIKINEVCIWLGENNRALELGEVLHHCIIDSPEHLCAGLFQPEFTFKMHMKNGKLQTAMRNSNKTATYRMQFLR